MNKEIVGKKIKVNDFNMEFGRQAKFVNLICFYKYQKDNNLYAIYCDDTNIPYGIINFGTAHIKGDSLIVIGSKDPDQEMIKEFTYKLSNNETLDNFEIQDITNINAIELVSPNKLEIKKEILASIVDKVIPKPKEVEKPVKNSSKKKKNTLLPLLLILIFICIVVYFFFFKTNEEKDNTTKMIICTRETKSKDLAANIIEDNTYNFNPDDKLEYINKSTTYKFYNEDDYMDFIDKGLYYTYIPEDNGGFTLDDDNYSLKVIEKETISDDYSLPIEYENTLKYYKDEGYNCTEQAKE